MAKIFLTGMTAPQTSEKVNKNSKTFSSVLHEVLTSAGHEVTWSAPSVTTTDSDLKEFDSVLVGIAPVGSLTSHKIYGALNVIDLAKKSGKLTLFVDLPNCSLITSSIKSMVNNPKSFTKSFYSKRKEYDFVVADPEVESRLFNVLKSLNDEEWPTTIYPKLPWGNPSQVKLSSLAKKNLHGVNLDSFYITELPDLNKTRADKWCVDIYNEWSNKTIKTLSLPSVAMRWGRGVSDNEVLDQISRSIGAIITTDKRDGSWWSYRYVQALNSNTPVATDWSVSQYLGSPWAVLASNIDTMAQENRDLLARAQKDIYTAKIGNQKSSLNELQSILRIS
jgi:hypothetical protein